jgi:hypothetical protein
MIPLIRRELVVYVPLRIAWQHLVRVDQWPSWANHIKSVEVVPTGELSAKSSVIIRLRNRLKYSLQVTEFHRYFGWKWIGRLLWLTIHYDHRFEVINDKRTKIIWIIGCEGIGASIIGRIFGAIYRRFLDRAIFQLQVEMNAIGRKKAVI